MDTYAVTITSTAGSPVTEVDALLEALPADAALGYNPVDREVSATFAVTARDVFAATSLGGDLLGTAMRAAGVKAFRHTEVEACPWSVHEARMDVSNLPELVGPVEAAEILGVSRQRVHQLTNDHPTFPPPLMRLASGPLWLRSTIEAFDRSWERKPGRPAKALTGMTIGTGPVHVEMASGGSVRLKR